MEDTEGNLIARANTYWTLLNMQTGRPVSIDEKTAAGIRIGRKAGYGLCAEEDKKAYKR